MRAIDTLDVPRFEGTVVVRYPLVTEPELAPPVLQLTPGLAASIDRAFPEPR